MYRTTAEAIVPKQLLARCEKHKFLGSWKCSWQLYLDIVTFFNMIFMMFCGVIFEIQRVLYIVRWHIIQKMSLQIFLLLNCLFSSHRQPVTHVITTCIFLSIISIKSTNKFIGKFIYVNLFSISSSHHWKLALWVPSVVWLSELGWSLHQSELKGRTVENCSWQNVRVICLCCCFINNVRVRQKKRCRLEKKLLFFVTRCIYIHV